MNCPVCNRPLKSPKSIAKGIGPVCELKINRLNNEPPEGQIKIDEYHKEGEENPSNLR